MSKESNPRSEIDASEKWKMPLSLSVSGTAMCAALYAIGSYLTAYVPSPWGAGQFRPAVVVPAFFAVVFGPIPAGVGAAIGTLIADSAKYGYLYPGSYLASVWGNFLGFFLFGLITRKFSWGRFVLASNVTLTVANFVVAVLYVMVFKILYLGDPKYLAFSNEAVVIFVLGLTVWWFVTMLPFVLLVTPILVVVAARTMPSFVNPSLRKQSLRQELPVNLFSTALLVPGVVMIALGLLTAYSSMGLEITRYFGATTAALVKWMFLLSGIALSVLGFGLKIRRRLFKS
ncbi:ECF transporter S component [Candidatus Bathyarchaeota archaeon]|nr:ECF transporter S component [Candidatus Bathyarchaeota archaeon]